MGFEEYQKTGVVMYVPNPDDPLGAPVKTTIPGSVIAGGSNYLADWLISKYGGSKKVLGSGETYWQSPDTQYRDASGQLINPWNAVYMPDQYGRVTWQNYDPVRYGATADPWAAARSDMSGTAPDTSGYIRTGLVPYGNYTGTGQYGIYPFQLDDRKKQDWFTEHDSLTASLVGLGTFGGLVAAGGAAAAPAVAGGATVPAAGGSGLSAVGTAPAVAGGAGLSAAATAPAVAAGAAGAGSAPSIAPWLLGGAALAGSYIAADKATDAITDAARTNTDLQKYIYDENRKLFEPFYNVGKNALPGLAAWDTNNPLPSYQETVLDPMNAWNYEQSPAYQAKYTLGMQELNKQLQARGLAPSTIGGNRATDLSRRLTADDYAAERGYELGNRRDLYNSLRSENTDRYNRILDQVKIAQGAAGSLGQAGNQYANQVGQSAMDAGQARAGFYSGLPGTVMNAGATGLKAYDYGQNQGWWGNGSAVTNTGLNAAATAYQPNMLPDQYAGGLYGL